MNTNSKVVNQEQGGAFLSNLPQEGLEVSDFHSIVKINEMPIGEALFFFYTNRKEIENTAYGNFEVWQGLELDVTKSNENDLIMYSKAVSFAVNTFLKNLEKSNLVVFNNLYKIQKEWNKGDKFTGGKVAKGYGYKVSRLKITHDFVKKLSEHYTTLTKPETIPF